MHLVDTQELRKRGLHREADVLDSLDEYEAGAAVGGTNMPAARIVSGDERKEARSAAPAGGGAGGGAEGAEATGSGASGGGAAGAVSGTSGSSSGAAATAGGGVGGGATADRESSASDGRQEGKPGATPSDIPTADPGSRDMRDDPLDGIYSERMRSRIERDAFRGANSTAQDSEIAAAADRVLPSELRAVLRHHDAPIDISPAARASRIRALNGEIPGWARGDPTSDPALLRVAESSAPHVTLREPAPTPTASRVAAIDVATAQPPAQAPPTAPRLAPRAPSSGREM